MSKSSVISIEVNLDENNHPKQMFWQADDAENPAEKKQVKAMLLSLFDKDHLDTLKIDLWTSELQVVEMDRFMFQTLKGLADSYFKATNNANLANAMQGFAEYFGEETDILPKGKDGSQG
jgi:gliding motility-associated protein GldC